VYGPDDWEDATLEQWLEHVEGGQGSAPARRPGPTEATAKR
jgi:hypothetical protein